jgi:hypothetical protein
MEERRWVRTVAADVAEDPGVLAYAAAEVRPRHRHLAAAAAADST